MKPIESFVPHRGAMLLIDRLIDATTTDAVAEVTIPADGLFVRDGHVPAWVGIEYMAQAIAAWSGAQHAANGGAPRIGMLLGSRRYVAHCSRFTAGDTLRIEVHQEFLGDNGLGQFDCRLLKDGTELATARLSIFEPDDGVALLSGGVSP